MAATSIVSEIPGNVWKIEVQPGSSVADGDVVVILESMKMEVPVQSTVAGTIVEITVQEGDFVNEGDVIARVET